MQPQQRQWQLNTGTTTSTTTSDSESAITAASFPRTLRLRGESQSHVATVGDSARTETPEQEAGDGSASRRVRWDEDVVNNEGMGKKSSKVCCIYHRPRAMDESSSESESSSSSDDSDTDDDSDMRARRRPVRREACGHDCHDLEHDHDHEIKKAKRKRPSPNAYERQPRNERRPTQQPQAD